RQTETLRSLVRETVLQPSALIAPFFVTHGQKLRRLIPSLPGQAQLSVDELLSEVDKAQRLGIQSVLLFGIPEKKDPLGKEAYAANGIVQQAIKAIKKKFPKIVVFADLCFCEYTDHGHCGVIRPRRDGRPDVDNDATLKLLQKTAVVQAQAGADFVAPSGMMDGAVEAIRTALDREGFNDVGIQNRSEEHTSELQSLT